MAATDQIRQMVNFILQEAHEKANEIRVKVGSCVVPCWSADWRHARMNLSARALRSGGGKLKKAETVFENCSRSGMRFITTTVIQFSSSRGHHSSFPFSSWSTNPIPFGPLQATVDCRRAPTCVFFLSSYNSLTHTPQFTFYYYY
jgi:hypothetical protein